MFVADWHIPVLKALRGLMIAMVLAALGLGPWRPDTNLPQAPDGLLVMSSAFLIATFSIIIVVYNLQWGHFAKKEAPDKRAAAARTILVFWDELLYVLVAFAALALNALSAVGYVGWLAAVSFTWFVGAVFLALVALEFHTSIRNVAAELPDEQPPPPKGEAVGVPAPRRYLQGLRGLVEGAATWLTFFFLFIFMTGQYSLPGTDLPLRAIWGFLLLGLVVFLRASWRPSTRWAGLIDLGKRLLMLGAGALLLLMAVVGIAVFPFVPGLSPGLYVFFVALSVLLLLQGVRMIRWVLRQRPGRALAPGG